jgi:hypothetical protein
MDLPEQVFGVIQNGMDDKTASSEGYRLNPKFSLWLMGYPVEWAYYGVLAM